MYDTIFILKQNDIIGKYGENVGCGFIVTEELKCIETYPTSSTIEEIGTNITRQQDFIEGTLKLRAFWFETKNQDKKSDYVITEGYYIRWKNEIFKIIGTAVYELCPCDYKIKLVGEKLFPREYRNLLVETDKSNTGNPDDLNSIYNSTTIAIEEHEENKNECQPCRTS